MTKRKKDKKSSYESLFEQFRKENPDWNKYLTDSTYYDLMSWFDDKKGYYDLDGYSDEAHMFADYVWYNYIVIPKFKIGDDIIPKSNLDKPLEITKIDNGYYYSEDLKICPIDEQERWKVCTDKILNKNTFNEVYVIEKMVVVGVWELMSDTFYANENEAVNTCLNISKEMKKYDNSFTVRVTKLKKTIKKWK